MIVCQWTEGMSVGVATLDSDHRCLLRIINLLAEVGQGAEPGTTVDTVLETLALYGRYHFAREEKLIGACGFPAAQAHHGEHVEFTDHIRDVRGQCAGRADPAMARDLLDYLSAWLRHHILIQDMAYKPYVRGLYRVRTLALGAGATCAPRHLPRC